VLIAGATSGLTDEQENDKEFVAPAQINKKLISELFRGVDQGERNISMARIAGYLLSYVVDPDEVIRYMLKINLRNRPPLHPDEVWKIFDSIKKIRGHYKGGLTERGLRRHQAEWEKAKPKLRKIPA
jgi:hypothetical protein